MQVPRVAVYKRLHSVVRGIALKLTLEKIPVSSTRAIVPNHIWSMATKNGLKFRGTLRLNIRIEADHATAPIIRIMNPLAFASPCNWGITTNGIQRNAITIPKPAFNDKRSLNIITEKKTVNNGCVFINTAAIPAGT